MEENPTTTRGVVYSRGKSEASNRRPREPAGWTARPSSDRTLTLTTVPEFQSKVHSDRSHNLILEFTHVPYIDSIGMGTLVDVNVRHRRDGNSVALVGASDRVRSVLKLARVDRFFRFFNSLAEAQAKLQ